MIRLRILSAAFLAFSLISPSGAQVVSPVISKAGQVDATDLQSLVSGIYAQSRARSPREKAEAIWRFFLTDGRFVKPGFWYHIAGWTYEEPLGEVLDPVKLLNSYGFGLCYHIAPLLSAVWDAGGFEDARVWFLTGHTVAEVYYDGAYHYFDSDMMGYDTLGAGPLKERPVASVHQIELDGSIILAKMAGPKTVDATAVDNPWYPADVRAGAIDGLARLFTTTNDNWLFAFRRYPQGHSMGFVLRPGEKMTRYFHPESRQLYYLPYKFGGSKWLEFPQEIAEYKIRTAEGPRSQKDDRGWATGRIDYRPAVPNSQKFVIAMPCPYVVIDAQFSLTVNLPGAGDALVVETSVDGGRYWTLAGSLNGPFHGPWSAAPAVIERSEGGRLTAVSGSYGYLVLLTKRGNARRDASAIRDLELTTRFQLNPRTLPELTPGHNELEYRTAKDMRIELPVGADRLTLFAAKTVNFRYSGAKGQGFVINEKSSPGEVVFAVAAEDGADLTGFDAGGRFLDLSGGLAPDKLTAEVRRVEPWPAKSAPPQAASISWSTSLSGPYRPLWTYDPHLTWKDGQPIGHTLRWPEVDRHVRGLPAGTRRVFVRYRIQGIAIDDFRLAAIRPSGRAATPIEITHLWRDEGVERSYIQHVEPSVTSLKYAIDLPAGRSVANEALILESAAVSRTGTSK